MTRTIRTMIALLAIMLVPATALAQAADAKPAEAAPAAEAPKPAAPATPPVLSKFNVSFYGYVNFDAIYDTTRSFTEGMGMNAVARPDTQAGENPRTIFTARNSRFGFRINAPEFEGIKASGNIETDFDTAVDNAADSMYTSGILRIRQANLKLETPIVDILMGMGNNLFGFTATYLPCDVAMLPFPGSPFGRNPQVRLTKIIKTAPLNLEVAVAAFRPPQRDAAIPDFQGGVRAMINGFKGIHTAGNGGTGPQPASIAVSGTYRKFKVGFSPADTATPPAPTGAEFDEESVTGSGVSIDALIPIIPSADGSKGNKLTLVGTYVMTKGANDLLGGLSGGATGFAGAPAGTVAVLPAGGLVGFDAGGFEAIKWTGIVAGAEYYLPPSGNVFIAAAYGHAKSDNLGDLTSSTKVWDESTHYDGSLFFDPTPAVRLGLGYQHREVKFLGDGEKAKSDRYHFTALYFF